mgnify:CR=1 FL=1|tara:strand:+ start:2557 stop:3438 length:882 start_codon:yes stop_codon:yes gene_type:complete
MKILITGVSGMLGFNLQKALEKDNHVFSTGNSNFPEEPKNYMVFDLKSNSYDKLITWSNPDLIILSGALTNGNYCNENPIEAMVVNGTSVNKFINATDHKVKIIYISTDAVFPSKLHLAKEKDCVFPENVYGKSKELGEFFLNQSDREFCIIRTTIVGLNSNSRKSGFVEWIINSAINNEEIKLFNDVIFTPISIWDFSKEIKYLISLKNLPRETLHITGSEIITKFEFGTELLKELKLEGSVVRGSSIKDFKDRAKRCTDQTLNVDYYQKKFKRILPNLKKTTISIKQNYYE